ncbi:YhgE/Pip-like protein [Lederbergia galactosidilyticus]|uniref:YhgE/Pip domain-containing protein n=1 Tax=Lederbergia galactosidilytica TaxID=217031 RepID=UPI001AE2DFE6|nr:ABC transporter permease [Lederbergia galactosidilytica]MBP1916109.1 YhgE/Pip-like protein [Lederbergia galactosidilytica]
MKSIQSFFKHKETYIGMGTALAFLVIFFCIWMTAYDGVMERTDNLRMGLVNEDKQLGTTIQEEITTQIPFEVKNYTSIEKAKKDLNRHELDMVVQIPRSFSEQLEGQGEANVIYFINQANATMSKQIMDGAAQAMTQSMNDYVNGYKQQQIVAALPQQFEAVIPSKELAQQLSKNMTEVFQSFNAQSVQASIEKTNNVDGFAATMVPLMIVLASFVGSMIMSMNLNIVALKLKNDDKKWALFIARQIINMGVALILAALTLVFLIVFQIEWTTNIWTVAMFQFFVYFAFLNLTQMFVVIFGTGGMLFNIIGLSLQLVTSGVIVPKVMLSDFYQAVGSYLPATYAVNGYYTVIFGGEQLSTDLIALLLVSAVTLFVAWMRISFQKTTTQTSKMTV